MINSDSLEQLMHFLPCRTPGAWVEQALGNLRMLLINHCYLEQCAARNAMTMMTRYPEKPDLLHRMSRLAREELVHFERVLAIIEKKGWHYRSHKPSRYVGLLQQAVSKQEPEKFIDSMIVGAFIEARSCERFYCLIPHLDEQLAKFYTSLLQSEARHFQDYLSLARRYAQTDLCDRIAFFAAIEKQAIESEDTLFRFHSGVPSGQAA